MAPAATEATADQTATKPPVRSNLSDTPRVTEVYAVAWRRPPRNNDKWPRRITEYRPTLQSAQHLAAARAPRSLEPPVVFVGGVVSWQVTS